MPGGWQKAISYAPSKRMRKTDHKAEYLPIAWVILLVTLRRQVLRRLAEFKLMKGNTQAERRALEAKHEYDHVSRLVKTEVARFEQERIEDFKNSLHAFLEGMISRQKEVGAGVFLYDRFLTSSC
jgi:predicted Holliday junction resolvase-like endonuclease